METSENKAVLFLRQKGFTILARNYKFFAVEVDILARKYIHKESLYCFVEVKRVRRKNYFAGYSVLSKRQYNRYREAIGKWEATYKPRVQVAIALLILDENEEVLELIENLSMENF